MFILTEEFCCNFIETVVILTTSHLTIAKTSLSCHSHECAHVMYDLCAKREHRGGEIIALAATAAGASLSHLCSLNLQPITDSYRLTHSTNKGKLTDFGILTMSCHYLQQ